MKPVRRNQRLGLIAFAGVLLIGALALTLTALSNSLSYFFTPSEVLALDERPTRTIRLGGLVMDGSVERKAGIETRFRITDGAGEIEVTYSGILPDLFREGQGVITEGLMLETGIFEAKSVLAKHDENYVPKELRQSLENKDGIL